MRKNQNYDDLSCDRGSSARREETAKSSLIFQNTFNFQQRSRHPKQCFRGSAKDYVLYCVGVGVVLKTLLCVTFCLLREKRRNSKYPVIRLKGSISLVLKEKRKNSLGTRHDPRWTGCKFSVLLEVETS